MRFAVTWLPYCEYMDPEGVNEQIARTRRWASTMGGHRSASGSGSGGVRHAHDRGGNQLGARLSNRQEREELEDALMARGATRATGAGNRVRVEEPDAVRTCFERDRDRILHASAFRRLAGKTQVFVHPEDHQRTRLTHALEVAQVARSIAAAVGANVALTEAIALGHDCGHGPGGHASEDAFSPYVEGGYDHAVWGADTVLSPLNLCAETLDGVRNHSWSRPTPSTPEGQIVSWADRIAYVCHDMEDAVHVGIVTEEMLPEVVIERCGRRRSDRLGAFIEGVTDATTSTGSVAMTEDLAEALAEFRAFNYEHIYMRPASVAQSEAVIAVLQALVEHYADRPNTVPTQSSDPLESPDPSESGESGHSGTSGPNIRPGSSEAYRISVTWVAGMTDHYAFNKARTLLDWPSSDLPRSI